MALHFTRLGEDELSIHFDIDGLAELLGALERAIRAAKEHSVSGAPDAIRLAVDPGSPNALSRVTLTLLDPTPPVTH